MACREFNDAVKAVKSDIISTSPASFHSPTREQFAETLFTDCASYVLRSASGATFPLIHSIVVTSVKIRGEHIGDFLLTNMGLTVITQRCITECHVQDRDGFYELIDGYVDGGFREYAMMEQSMLGFYYCANATVQITFYCVDAIDQLSVDATIPIRQLTRCGIYRSSLRISHTCWPKVYALSKSHIVMERVHPPHSSSVYISPMQSPTPVFTSTLVKCDIRTVSFAFL